MDLERELGLMALLRSVLRFPVSLFMASSILDGKSLLLINHAVVLTKCPSNMNSHERPANEMLIDRDAASNPSLLLEESVSYDNIVTTSISYRPANRTEQRHSVLKRANLAHFRYFKEQQFGSLYSEGTQIKRR